MRMAVLEPAERKEEKGDAMKSDRKRGAQYTFVGKIQAAKFFGFGLGGLRKKPRIGDSNGDGGTTKEVERNKPSNPTGECEPL
jgi:hypothetical protein